MRTNRYSRLLPVLFFSMLLAACGKYTILLPEEDAEFLDGVPDQFVIQYENQAPKKISLNGVDITKHFTLDGSQATATGVSVDGYLIEGNNILSVTPGINIRNFYYDSEGPSVINREVVMLGGNNVNIKGNLKDPSADRGPMTLRLNNIPVTVDANGNFEITTAHAEYYTFNSSDALGHEAEVVYADRGNIVDNMVALEITESAINDFVPVFQEVIEEVDLSQGSPIALFRENIGIRVPKKCAPIVNWPCIGPINFDILSAEVSLTGGKVEELTFGQIDLKSGYSPLRGYWNGFAFDVVAEDGYVEGQTKLDVLGLSSTVLQVLSWFGLEDDLQFLAGIYNVGMPIDRFHLAATLAVESEGGKMKASLISLDDLGMGPWDAGDLDLVVPDFIKSFPFGLFEAILDTIFNGLEAVRDLILDIIGKIVAPLVGNVFIDLFLNEVPQVHVGVGFNNGALFSALLKTDRISIQVASSGVSDDDRLLLTMDGRVGSEASGDDPNVGLGLGQPTETWLDQYFSDHFFPDGGSVPKELGPSPGIAPQSLGFIYTDTALPDPSSNAELAVNLSSNLINQALLGVYESGLTTLSLPLEAEGLSAIITEPENANTLVNFEPSIPTQVVFKGQTNAIAYMRIANVSAQ